MLCPLKKKSRVKFINGFELIINNEFGHIDDDIYEVQEYNYHYNAPNDFFRFESKPDPHINDSNDIHWIYNNNSPFHNSSLEVRRTRLQTEQLNLFIVLNICYEYIVSGKYPVFEENIDYYNCKIKKFRSELR